MNATTVDKAGTARHALSLAALLSERALAARRPATMSTFLCTARFECMLRRYLQKLARALTNLLSLQVRLHAAMEQSPNALSSQGEEMQIYAFLLVEIRVFQEQLVILLPIELVRRLASVALRREESRLLNPPDEEEMTAIGLLIARLLGEEELFRHQGIYLASLRAVTGSDLNNCLNAMLADSDRAATAALHIEVEVGDTHCRVPVLIESRLAKRLSQYSRTRLFRSRTVQAAGRTLSLWRLHLGIEINSLAVLLDIAPGSRLSLERCRGSLQQLKERQLRGETDGDKQVLVVMLECASLPNLLRLRLVGE